AWDEAAVDVRAAGAARRASLREPRLDRSHRARDADRSLGAGDELSGHVAAVEIDDAGLPLERRPTVAAPKLRGGARSAEAPQLLRAHGDEHGVPGLLAEREVEAVPPVVAAADAEEARAHRDRARGRGGARVLAHDATLSGNPALLGI